MLEYLLDLDDVPCCAYPQFFSGIAETLSLYVSYLSDRVVSLLSPLQFLVEKVEHCEIKRPDIVATREVNVVVGVETCKRHCASEINFFSFCQRLLRQLIKVLFREAEVNNVDAA